MWPPCKSSLENLQQSPWGNLFGDNFLWNLWIKSSNATASRALMATLRSNGKSIVSSENSNRKCCRNFSRNSWNFWLHFREDFLWNFDKNSVRISNRFFFQKMFRNYLNSRKLRFLHFFGIYQHQLFHL